MTLIRTNRLAQSIADDGTPSGSWTPAANSLLVAVVHTMRNGATTPYTPGSLTFADSGGRTWTRRKFVERTEDYALSVGVWTASAGGSPSATAVSVTKTVGDGGYLKANVAVYEYSGADLTSPMGASSADNTGPTDGPATLTLDAAPASTSEVLSILSAIVNGSNEVLGTVPSGYTQIDRIHEASFFSLQIAGKTGTTSTAAGYADTLDPASTDTNFSAPIMLALEIKVDGSSLPTFSVQPTDQVVTTQHTAALSVTSSDATSYQWKVKPPGGSYSNVSTGSGGTTNAYTTGTLSRSDTGTKYKCAATNANGSTDSNEVTVTVLQDASVLVHYSGSAWQRRFVMAYSSPSWYKKRFWKQPQ